MKSLAQSSTRSRSSSQFRFQPMNNGTRKHTIFISRASISRTKAAKKICDERSISFRALVEKDPSIFARLDRNRKSLVFFGGRLRKTARSLPGIKGSGLKGDCAGRERCGGALLPERSETSSRLGPGRRGCRVEARAPARSQLGASSLLLGAAASLPRRAKRRASTCARS